MIKLRIHQIIVELRYRLFGKCEHENLDYTAIGVFCSRCDKSISGFGPVFEQELLSISQTRKYNRKKYSLLQRASFFVEGILTTFLETIVRPEKRKD